MRVTLLSHTPEPEKTIAMAARLCYSPSGVLQLKQKLDSMSVEKLVRKIVRMGHHSVLEHVSFTFGIEGISRATSHQLVRHRLASYSQQSQRYVVFKDSINYITPPTVEQNKEAKNIFEKITSECFEAYQKLIKLGVPVEDARYVLPNASETRIMVTMNARELLHFFKLRGCRRAQWEIRALSMEMLSIVKNIAPIVFEKAGPGCLTGGCTEGEFYCGDIEGVRREFAELNKNSERAKTI
jgi:thymidylate synthase (FAD)